MSEPDVSTQKRKHERHSPEQVVDVYDTARDVYLGRLVNIHANGLMVIGDISCEEDHLYKLDLQLSKPINNRNTIHVGADCMWTRDAGDNAKLWSGFSIIDVSPEGSADIDNLIKEFN